MAADFQFTPKALDDLDTIWDFIAADIPVAADRVESAILEACELLSRHPQLGAKRGEITRRPVRFWCVSQFPNYLVVYRPDTKPIRIIRVLHGRRNISSILGTHGGR